MHQSMLEADNLEIRLAEKDLNVLMDKLSAVNPCSQESFPAVLTWGDTSGFWILDSGFWMLCWSPHSKRAHGFTGVTSRESHKDD